MVTATVRSALHQSKDKIEISRTTLWGIGLSLLGLLIAAFSIYVSSLVAPSAQSFTRLFFDVLVLVGMAFFSMGIFSILLDTKGWKEYFEEGLKGIVLQFLPYLLDDDPDDQRQDRGFFYARYRSWIMPKSGFAWKLLPLDLPTRVRNGNQSEPSETLEDVLDDGGD